jgi:hypothetical protein
LLRLLLLLLLLDGCWLLAGQSQQLTHACRSLAGLLLLLLWSLLPVAPGVDQGRVHSCVLLLLLFLQQSCKHLPVVV